MKRREEEHVRSLRVLVAIAFTAVSTPADAGTGRGVLLGVLPYSCSPAECFFVQSTTNSGLPSCNTSGRFVISVSDPKYKTVVATLLAAYHAQTPVTLYGAGTCSTWSNAEDLAYVCVGDMVGC